MVVRVLTFACRFGLAFAFILIEFNALLSCFIHINSYVFSCTQLLVLSHPLFSLFLISLCVSACACELICYLNIEILDAINTKVNSFLISNQKKSESRKKNCLMENFV